jgi:hypothetical protein
MSPPEGIDSLSREELLALVLQLQHKLIELEASVLDLRAEVDRLTREKKRQAAPFPRGPGPSHPSVQAASLGKAPSLFARHHAPKTSPDPQ